jgi:hypothetical protein
MAITIGRLGYLGLGIEDTVGSAVTADIFVPYTDVSMRGHHEPIEVTSSKTSRSMDVSSVLGKKWSEGDVKMNLDIVNSGYLWKLALGNEICVTATPNVHTFYVSVSGNTPKTATLIFGRDTDVEQYVQCAVDELKLDVKDGLGELSASFKGQFPTVGSPQTVVMTSGTVLSFKDMSVKFGNTLTAANSASATPINEFSLSISNNIEMIYRSGTNDVSTVRNKGLRVTGSYKVFFDSEADKNAYYNLNKRSMQVTFSGNANETLVLHVPQFRLNEGEISTGLDDFFVITGNFVAEDVIDNGIRLFDAVLSNDKTSVY